MRDARRFGALRGLALLDGAARSRCMATRSGEGAPDGCLAGCARRRALTVLASDSQEPR